MLINLINQKVAQMVKRLSTVWETWARSLGWEDPLEEELATHSSILAWKIPWVGDPDKLQSITSKRMDTTEHEWINGVGWGGCII